MVYREYSSLCRLSDRRTTGGLGFTSVNGAHRLDFISVSEPSIATLSGVRVGSTLAEVRRAYGDEARGCCRTGGARPVYRPDDPSLDHLALALLFSESKVAGMWAGLRVVAEADGVCA